MGPEQTAEIVAFIMKSGGLIAGILIGIYINGKIQNWGKRLISYSNYRDSMLGRGVHVMFGNATGATEWICQGLDETKKRICFKEIQSGNMRYLPLMGFENFSFDIVGQVEDIEEDESE